MAPKSFSPEHAEPEIHPANPGQGSQGTIALSSQGKEWTEELNLFEILREVLAKGGFGSDTQEDWLVSEIGLWLKPQIVSFAPHDDGWVKTCTTIEVAHPSSLSLPCFEFQHSVGDSVTASVRRGFEEWAQIDWPVFVHLASDQGNCMVMELEGGDAAEPKRRILLGPVRQFMREPAPVAADGEEHDFCPCCLLTNCLITDSGKALMSEIFSNGTRGLRFFAMRNESGEVSADCRINGEDFEPGAEALKAYAATWPQRGFETRKQYALIEPKP